MKDKIYYYDRNGTLQLTLNEYPYYSEPRDLFDWTWGFNEQFGKINTFRRAKGTYDLLIGIAGEFSSRHNALCDIFSADVLANEPGYLLINGWKLPCYIIEAENTVVFDRSRQSRFTVRAINSTWIRENTTSYNGAPGGGSLGDDLGRDYIFSYAPPEEYTDSGEIVKIENDEEDLTLTSLMADIEPILGGSGTPSPTNVRPISGHTDVAVSRTGKNLLDTSTAEIGTAWNGASNSARARLVIPLVVGQTYTLKANGTSTLDSWYGIETDTIPPSSAGSVLSNPYTFTATTKYLSLGFNKTAIASTDIEALKLQLEYGSTATAYEQYQGTTNTTDLGRTVYGGTLDVTSGVLTVDRAIVTYDGSNDEVWQYYSVAQGNLFRMTQSDRKAGELYTVGAISNRFELVTNANRTNGTMSSPTSGSEYAIDFIYDACTTEAQWRTWLSSNNVQVVYPLATPQTYQLTAQQISLLTGDNYLWASTGGVIDVAYETISVPVPTRGYNYGYSQPESHYASIDLAGTNNGFEAIIYGPQVNPVIYLNNQPVQVNVELTATQRLRIVSNGSVKTIEILEANGTSTDAFVYRDKENTPFLTLGQHTDLTFGQVRFDFTTIERRSQPTWN